MINKKLYNGDVEVKTIPKKSKAKHIPWRRDRRYAAWIRLVKRRDKKCRICGSTERLAAHHLEDGSNNPELRYELSNGVSLCGSRNGKVGGCHMNFHCNFKKSYRQKCTKDDYLNFEVLSKYFKGMNNE